MTQEYQFSEQAYLELESEKLELESKKQDLEAKVGTFKIATIICAVLLALSLAYIVYAEVAEPPFGKWPQVAQQNAMLHTRVDELSALKPRLDSLIAANNILSEQSDAQDGVFFEVQIGAFENFNMDKYMEQLAQLKKERVDVLDKYTLGKFRNYKTAELFTRDIKRMGIVDAFIVAKMDGQRIDVQEAKNAAGQASAPAAW